MEKYVQYLLTDLRDAADNISHLLINQDEDEDFGYLPAEEEEQYAPRQLLSDRLRVQPEWFPPPERLTDDQIERILSTLEDCLEACALFAIFPEKVPVRQRYEMLLQKLDTDVPILQHNVWQIEFCDFDPGCCPFNAEHCRCRELEDLLTDSSEEDVFDWEDEDEDEGFWLEERENWRPDEEEEYLGPGFDISGYDMPELFSGRDGFELWSEDELDPHGWSRSGRAGNEDDDLFSDGFAPPDIDSDEEDSED